MGATLDRSAAIGQQAITISGPAARRGGPAAGRCVARMGTLLINFRASVLFAAVT